MIVAARRGLARGLTDLQSVGRTAQTPVFIGQYGNAPDPCQHYVSGATESAALHGRAALDGKTVRRQRLATVRQPSAAPILSIRNGSHRRGGTSPAWYVRRFCSRRHPSPQRSRVSLRCTSVFSDLADGALWGGFAGIGSLRRREPAISSHIVRSRAGPSPELNLGFGGVCSRTLPPCGRPVQRRHGPGACRPIQNPSRLCSPPPTRSQGASRGTKARYGDRCPLSPRGRVREWVSGVWGCRTAPSGGGGPSAALSVAVGCLP